MDISVEEVVSDISYGQIVEHKRNWSKYSGEYIFFLLDDEEIVYVGQTTQLESRLIYHAASQKQYNAYTTIRFKDVSPEELTELEVEFIVKFNPKYNQVLPANDRYKTKSGFKKDLDINGLEFRKVVREKNLMPVYQDYYRVSDFFAGGAR